MRATILNCTLKPSPEESNTDALAEVVAAGLRQLGTEIRTIRLVDHNIKPGVSSDMGEGDDWPRIREEVLNSEILVVATPTWVGHPSSIAQRMLERMDAMLSETKDDGTPVAYNRVAGVVVTGNEDGAHHVISEISGGLNEIGFTIPGQAWVYWNMGPGPGPSYTDTDHGHQYAHQVAGLMAKNLYATAVALRENPVPASVDRGED
ncbi:flavodoxin family protein [Amycolatopsis endophytica]|uniref:Multimeric flavodoxin WrbA n=1 Tax=Amycolatopsis endophytica TaxID=860233 RepID=A0A853B543_9PSEU|nr:flavodoxin family protein [Amycolatopsis endophytica]NYI89706.1 multimeric flavodoxin WrbA [Amycolatopsis endophytica]